MINETFLRQSVKELNNGDNVYIYNKDFIDIIVTKYYKKYSKQLYLEKKKDYFVLTTKKRNGTQFEL